MKPRFKKKLKFLLLKNKFDFLFSRRGNFDEDPKAWMVEDISTSRHLQYVCAIREFP